MFHEGDHFRTRLTHTLEVTQIARSLARALGLDEDLAEALALAHDLGHPPFGHAGERALDRCLAACGGFDHNAQTLRVVTALERRYAGFDGLNLSWETLEGLVKHNGPLTDRAGNAARTLSRARRAARHPALWSARISSCGASPAPRRRSRPSPTTSPMMPTTSTTDCAPSCSRSTIWPSVPLVRDIAAAISAAAIRNSMPPAPAHELVRRLITRLIEDVIAETGRRLEALAPSLGRRTCVMPGRRSRLSRRAMAEADRAIKGFLYPRMYRHARVSRIMTDAEGVVCDLFARYAASTDDLPAEWAQGAEAGDEAARLRRIADFIAGMTDRYALVEHARLFPSTPQLQ